MSRDEDQAVMSPSQFLNFEEGWEACSLGGSRKRKMEEDDEDGNESSRGKTPRSPSLNPPSCDGSLETEEIFGASTDQAGCPESPVGHDTTGLKSDTLLLSECHQLVSPSDVFGGQISPRQPSSAATQSLTSKISVAGTYQHGASPQTDFAVHKSHPQFVQDINISCVETQCSTSNSEANLRDTKTEYLPFSDVNKPLEDLNKLVNRDDLFKNSTSANYSRTHSLTEEPKLTNANLFAVPKVISSTENSPHVFSGHSPRSCADHAKSNCELLSTFSDPNLRISSQKSPNGLQQTSESPSVHMETRPLVFTTVSSQGKSSPRRSESTPPTRLPQYRLGGASRRLSAASVGDPTSSLVLGGSPAEVVSPAHSPLFIQQSPPSASYCFAQNKVQLSPWTSQIALNNNNNNNNNNINQGHHETIAREYVPIPVSTVGLESLIHPLSKSASSPVNMAASLCVQQTTSPPGIHSTSLSSKSSSTSGYCSSDNVDLSPSPQTDNRSTESPPDAKSLRFQKTAAALQNSGLWEIAMKTGRMVKKNIELQKELEAFKVEALNLIKSVLKNPENKPFIRAVIQNAMASDGIIHPRSIFSLVVSAASQAATLAKAEEAKASNLSEMGNSGTGIPVHS